MLNHGVIKATLAASVLALAGLAMSQANAACNLVSTKDNSPLKITVADDDTPEAKQFLLLV